MNSYSFLQKVPFIRLTLALLAGILCFNYFGFLIGFFIGALSIALLAFAVNLLLRKPAVAYRFRWVFGVCVFCSFFAIGMFLSWQRSKQCDFSYYNQSLIYEAEVCSAPIEKPKSILCQVRLQNFLNEKGESVPVDNKMLVYFEKDSLAGSLEIGQHLLMCAKFSEQKPTGNPDEFDYAKYLQRKGITASAYIPARNWKMLSEHRKNLRYWSERCRRRLLNVYRENNIQGDEFAVLAALTLGAKEFLTDDLQNDFTSAGVTHVLAVSGLHVGVIYMVLMFALSFWGSRHRYLKTKNVIIIAFLMGYAFITGLSPSVVRSVLMFSLVGIGVMLGRRSLIYNTIFLSAFFMLLFNPDYIYDVGFQLSYVAVLSIVVFCPFLMNLVHTRRRAVRYLWDLFSVSISAQLGTVSLTMYYFHQFPNYFWISNMLIVPLSSFVIYAAVALFFLSGIPVLGSLSAFVLAFLTKTMNIIVHSISDIPCSVTTDIGFGLLQFWLLFLAVAFLMSAFVRRIAWQMLCSLSLLAMFFVVQVVEDWNTSKERKLLVFYDKSQTTLALQDGLSVEVMTTDTTLSLRYTESYRIRHRLWCEKVLLKNDDWKQGDFFTFSDKRFLVLSSNVFAKKERPDTPIFVDYLILANKTRLNLQKLLDFVQPRHVVLDATVPAWKSEEYKEICAEKQIDCYAILESGAFVQNF